MNHSNYFTVKSGDKVTFDVLTWQHEGYEFGRPCLMLSPVIREDSDSDPESMIEDVCIDLCCSIPVQLNRETSQIEWRRWNLKTLRRAFNQALAGKKFPVAGYCATRKVVQFSHNKNGEMIWVDI